MLPTEYTESQSAAEATEIEQYLVMILDRLPKTGPPETILPTSEAKMRAKTQYFSIETLSIASMIL